MIGLLGVLVATGLWWLYFDLISDRPPRPRLAMPWLLVGALAVAMRRCTGPIPHANGGIAVLRTGEGPVARRR